MEQFSEKPDQAEINFRVALESAADLLEEAAEHPGREKIHKNRALKVLKGLHKAGMNYSEAMGEEEINKIMSALEEVKDRLKPELPDALRGALEHLQVMLSQRKKLLEFLMGPDMDANSGEQIRAVKKLIEQGAHFPLSPFEREQMQELTAGLVMTLRSHRMQTHHMKDLAVLHEATEASVKKALKNLLEEMKRGEIDPEAYEKRRKNLITMLKEDGVIAFLAKTKNIPLSLN